MYVLRDADGLGGHLAEKRSPPWPILCGPQVELDGPVLVENDAGGGRRSPG